MAKVLSLKNLHAWSYWALAFFAFVVLAFAAVWMGGVNQDEGWYLYAANLVADGQMPYRDFAFTQGPMLPFVYSVFVPVWNAFGLAGARVFTLLLGLAGIVFFCATAKRLAPKEQGNTAALVTFFLTGVNLYHLYFLAMPKTYALAALFVAVGCWLLTFDGLLLTALAAFTFALAAGTRISLGAILAVLGLVFLIRRDWRRVGAFAVGGFAGLALVYGPFLIDAQARAGLLAAQKYHAGRGGFDLVFVVGSLSRLVRWYLPVFIVLGLGVAKWLAGAHVDAESIPRQCGENVSERRGKDSASTGERTSNLLLAFLAVFAVQLLAPFPYEDYQVPIMGLLTVFAAVTFTTIPYPLSPIHYPLSTIHYPLSVIRYPLSAIHYPLLLVLGLSFATAFGSPLLEKWTTNGQDRFWTLKKDSTELAQLREAARKINALDPGGKTIFTQDTYLAVEMGRKVPKGLEMGPFSMLDDAGWRRLISTADAPVAAISGYTFAVEPPLCRERPVSQQVEYFSLLKKRYKLVERMDAFGQNSTTLMILKRK